MSFSAKHSIRHLVSQKTHKRRIAWLLLASFLFQAALPVLAQVASTGAPGEQLPFCSMQGTRLVSLPGDFGPSEEIASSIQLCPFCLLTHLAHISLPVADGLLPDLQLEKDTWFSPVTSRAHHHIRISHTPIRAPPQA